jgi:lipoprotein signal peptidase
MAGSSELRAAEAEYTRDAAAKLNYKTPWLIYVATAFFVALDRWFKHLALTGVSAGLADRIEFTLFLNRGIAFSIPVPDLIFWPAAGMAMLVLLWSFFKSLRTDPRGAALFMLIIAGAISNLYDRVMHDATVDYLLFFGRSAVNLADGMIIGGLIALLKQKS